MSRIVFDDEYVIVVPTFKEVVPHKHSFLHIFFLGDSRKCEEIFVTGSDMRHTMPSIDVCKVFLMVDPTNRNVKAVRNKFFTEILITDFIS